jgi:uncharacterized membrane protein
MIELLASIAPGLPELVIIAIVFLVVVAIPVAFIIFLVIYLVQNNKERRQLRTEVERLTEEVNRLKQERQ